MKTVKSSNENECYSKKFGNLYNMSIINQLNKRRLGMSTLKYGIEYYKHPELSEEMHGISSAFENDYEFFIKNIEKNYEQTESSYYQSVPHKFENTNFEQNQEFSTLKYGIEYYKHPNAETDNNLNQLLRNAHIYPDEDTKYSENNELFTHDDPTSFVGYPSKPSQDWHQSPQISTYSNVMKNPKPSISSKLSRFGIEYYQHPEQESDDIYFGLTKINADEVPNIENIKKLKTISKDVIKSYHDDDNNQFLIPIPNIERLITEYLQDYENNQDSQIEVINNAHPLLSSYEEPKYSSEYSPTFNSRFLTSDNGKLFLCTFFWFFHFTLKFIYFIILIFMIAVMQNILASNAAW